MRSREVSGWKHLGRRVVIREWFNTKAGARFDVGVRPSGDHPAVRGRMRFAVCTEAQFEELLMHFETAQHRAEHGDLT